MQKTQGFCVEKFGFPLFSYDLIKHRKTKIAEMNLEEVILCCAENQNKFVRSGSLLCRKPKVFELKYLVFLCFGMT